MSNHDDRKYGQLWKTNGGIVLLIAVPYFQEQIGCLGWDTWEGWVALSLNVTTFQELIKERATIQDLAEAINEAAKEQVGQVSTVKPESSDDYPLS